MKTTTWSSVRELFGMFSGLLIICVAGLLILLFGGIVPAARNTEDTRAEIESLRAELQKREALLPVYALLRQQAETAPPDHLIVPEPRRLPLDELPGVPALLEEMAAANGLELVSATPQVRALSEGRDGLRVDARLRGEFLPMRDFLLSLGGFPSMERLEGVSVMAVDAGRELRVTIWLKIG